MKERKGWEEWGEDKERETVIFLHICVTWGLSKLMGIAENPKTKLKHSFYDLSGEIFVFCSAEFNLDTRIFTDLNHTLNWNHPINLNLPFVEIKR